MSDFGGASIVVNVVGAESEAGDFLQEIVLFVGQLGRGDHADTDALVIPCSLEATRSRASSHVACTSLPSLRIRGC